MYIDGVDRTGTVTNFTAVNTDFPVRIGANNGPEFLDGWMDEVAVYPTAISAARALDHYRSGQPYPGQVLEDSVAAYWRLGDGSGTSARDAKGANAGTYTNAPTLGSAGALSGYADTATAFDGTNDYVNVPDAAALDLANGPLTIEAWVKRSANNVTHTIVDKGTNAYKLYLAADNRLTFRKAGVGNIVASTSTITDTAWHHVAATKSGTTSRLYVDGNDVTGTVTDQALADTTSPLGIGAISGGTAEWWSGSLDEVAVYNAALSAEQVAAHHALGKTP
jgi:hypothetical protein